MKKEDKNLKIPKRRAKKSKLLLYCALLLILIGIGVIIYPLMPKIQYAVNPPENFYPYETKLLSEEKLARLPEVQERMKPVPEGNRLVIPKIGVDAPIVEGENEKASLARGVWHIPGTSTPPEGGNTVISGHRFRYRPPNNTTFYLLDRLEEGDPIIVYWNKEEYDYQVTGMKITEPNDISIHQNTDKPVLTLYTCTPLFTTKQRLVVLAEPIPEE